MLHSFAPLQLEGFIALWHAYNPQRVIDPAPVSVNPRTPLSCRRSLTQPPIGSIIWKYFDGGLKLQSQVYDKETATGEYDTATKTRKN